MLRTTSTTVHFCTDLSECGCLALHTPTHHGTLSTIMTTTPTTTVIATRIQQLVAERKKHADAVAAIDQILSQIGKLLGTKTPALSAPATKAPLAAAKRSRRRTFPTTGAESVLEFVKKSGGATTKEIQKHWKSQGRGGTADNAISQLFKDKKLKRTPLKDRPGSRYTLL